MVQEYITNQLDIKAWDDSTKSFTSLIYTPYPLPYVPPATAAFTQNNIRYIQMGITNLALPKSQKL